MPPPLPKTMNPPHKGVNWALGTLFIKPLLGGKKKSQPPKPFL